MYTSSAPAPAIFFSTIYNQINMTNPQFDVVIPLGPDDIDVLDKVVSCTKKNVIGCRNIYVITYKPEDLKNDDCIFINENIFPFNINTLGEYTNYSSRTGWYLQQLLKLHAGFYVPDILENYLVIDADTCFVKPTSFFEDGIPLYNVGTEYFIQYFQHMQKLHPSLVKQNQYSGVCHHMLFNRELLKHLFSMVELNTGDIFWHSFMKYLDPQHIYLSGASEYEIYFNFLLIYHRDKMKIRELRWMNVFQKIPDLNYYSWHHHYPRR